MKIGSWKAQLALSVLAVLLAEVVLGSAFRVWRGRWPGDAFWLVGVLVYLGVALPALRRQWNKAHPMS